MINNEEELFILLKEFINDPDFNFVKVLIPINIKNDSSIIYYDTELKEFFRTYNDKYKNYYQVANNFRSDNIEYIEFKNTNSIIHQQSMILKYVSKDEFNILYENIEFIGLPIKIIRELITYDIYKKFIYSLKYYSIFDFFKFLNHIKLNNISEKIIFNIFDSKINLMNNIEIDFEITFEKEFKNKNEINIFINSFNGEFKVDSSYLNIINDNYSCNSLSFISNGKDKLRFVI